MSKMHTIEVYDSSDSHYKYYDTDDFEIDGHTLEEHDKQIRTEALDEYVAILKNELEFYDKHGELIVKLAEQLKGEN